MKRVKLLQVTLNVPIECDDDSWDLEIEDDLFEILQLAHGAMSKASQEIGEAVLDAKEDAPQDHPCKLIVIEGDYEDMTLEELRRKPQRTRQQH